eukprot:gnl/Dysnectes_brevis/982_a1094_3011.p1 GENE.gnl/Dysnectes_brevis/982_a1094_3011~~gnl/Dysnectes_brevis/982_a1094_3011.p1  ORF type:complete len:490 (+),score=126.24 gnl/Dysnectes_brevis/982_a1094_3011:29-1471(+)
MDCEGITYDEVAPVPEPKPISRRFTCLTCRLAFSTFEDQKSHFQTQFHRENCKLKGKGHLIMTAEQYLKFLEDKKREKEAQLQSKKKKKERVIIHCDCCRKTFKSEKAFDSHCKSKKHQMAARSYQSERKEEATHQVGRTTGRKEIKVVEHVPVVKESHPKRSGFEHLDDASNYVALGEEKTWETLLPRLSAAESDEERDLIVFSELISKRYLLKTHECIFCDHELDSFESLMDHMSSCHSFFVPARTYCIDLEGLIAYLQRKLSYGLCCIQCDKSFRSLRRARHHMTNTGHHQLPALGVSLELRPFFDFTDSYSEETLERLNAAAIPESERAEMLEELKAYRSRPFLESTRRTDDGRIMLPSGKLIALRAYRAIYRAVVPRYLAERAAQKMMAKSLLTAMSAAGRRALAAGGEEAETALQRVGMDTGLLSVMPLGGNVGDLERSRMRESTQYQADKTLDRGKTGNRDKSFYRSQTLHLY